MIIHDYAALRENSPFNHVWHFLGSSVEVWQNFIHRYFQQFSFSFTWESTVQNRKVTCGSWKSVCAAEMAREEKTTDGQICTRYSQTFSCFWPSDRNVFVCFLEDVSRTYILVVLHNDSVVYCTVWKKTFFTFTVLVRNAPNWEHSCSI